MMGVYTLAAAGLLRMAVGLNILCTGCALFLEASMLMVPCGNTPPCPWLDPDSLPSPLLMLSGIATTLRKREDSPFLPLI